VFGLCERGQPNQRGQSRRNDVTRDPFHKREYF
jgi:hypothetical protein